MVDAQRIEASRAFVASHGHAVAGSAGAMGSAARRALVEAGAEAASIHYESYGSDR